MTAIAHADFLGDTEVREGHRLRRALLIEDLTAVPTVMLAVGEAERCTTSQADVGVDPFWRGLGVDHGGAYDGRVPGREFES